MQDWQESAWIAIQAVIAATIVTVVVVLMTLGKNVLAASYEDRRVTEAMQEYRKYNQYDNKEVYSQDIVSLVFENRGEPYVKVTTRGGAVKEWSKNTQSTAYTSDAVTAAIPISDMYDSQVIKDSNGAVVGYEFRGK